MAAQGLRVLREEGAGVEGNVFPERLRRLRERRRVSRYVVSELCGLNRNAVRRYERGEAEPTMKALVSIADYFGVSIDYLVGSSDEPK